MPDAAIAVQGAQDALVQSTAATAAAKASVISSCRWRCTGRAPRTARMRVIGPAPAGRRRPGDADRGPERRPALRDQGDRGQGRNQQQGADPQRAVAASLAAATTTEAAPRTATAAIRVRRRPAGAAGRDAGRLVVGQVGQGVDQVRADAQQGRDHRDPRRGRRAGRPARVTNTAMPPNATAYGSHDQAVALSPRL